MRTVSPFMMMCGGLAGCVMLEAASLLSSLPKPQGDVLVAVVSPFAEDSAERIVARTASGRIVGPMAGMFSVFVMGATEAQLYDAGAWLVVDGRLAAGLCGLDQGD